MVFDMPESIRETEDAKKNDRIYQNLISLPEKAKQIFHRQMNNRSAEH